jgi:hypothetical protein
MPPADVDGDLDGVLALTPEKTGIEPGPDFPELIRSARKALDARRRRRRRHVALEDDFDPSFIPPVLGCSEQTGEARRCS